MKLLKIAFVLTMLFLQTGIISAQDDPEPVTIPFSETRSLYSEEIDQEFVISVALPWLYFESDKTYPVLYILDPDVSFATMTNITELGAFTNRLPEVIVVGIGYPFGTSPGPERGRDYVENPEAFLQFIENDLMPMIEGDYRANPSERAIAGWGAGGYFAIYALFNNPTVFNRYLVISLPLTYPSSDFPSVSDYEEAFADNPTPLFARVFLSGGTLDILPVDWWEAFTETVNSRHYTGLQLATTYIEGAEHTTALPMALALGARDIYCFSIPNGCSEAMPIVEYQVIEDADFPVDLMFRTPDAFLILKVTPEQSAITIGQCRDMDATILQVVETLEGDTWVRLDCGENVGWAERSRLEN